MVKQVKNEKIISLNDVIRQKQEMVWKWFFSRCPNSIKFNHGQFSLKAKCQDLMGEGFKFNFKCFSWDNEHFQPTFPENQKTGVESGREQG